MNRADQIIKNAHLLLEKYGIQVPSLDDVVLIIKDLGYDVVDFSPTNNSDSTESLIKTLSLTDYQKNGTAIAYHYGDIKIVLVCDALDEIEKKIVLTHELGHIVCGHLEQSGQVRHSVQEEYEANEFSHYFLNPGYALKTSIWLKNHKAVPVVVVVLCIVLAAVSIFGKNTYERSKYYGEYYISENGEKYHVKDCSVIKDKTNIHRLTIEEYQTGGYTPCHLCLPDGGN